MNLLSPRSLEAAAANLPRVVGGGIADLRPMPRTMIDHGPQRALYRYEPAPGVAPAGPPVLLVPPLAAPALCFDLRRGCSLVEHLVQGGRPTYLVDYGRIAFSDRALGIEHWVTDVVPAAARAVRRDSGRRPILVGWSLGGIFTLFAAASNQRLPVAGVAAIGTPFDITRVPLVAPMRPLVNLTGGRILTTAYRLLGGAPAPLVKRAFQLTSADKYLTKPIAILTRLDDTDFLAQLEAVDRFTDRMLAYPGRTFGQLYHRLFRTNSLAEGRLRIGGRELDVADVRVPVLVIAGNDDVLAPRDAVHHVTYLLTGSPFVDYHRAPGGHLGVLTGRRARGTTWRHLDRFIDRLAEKPGRGKTPRPV